MRFTLQAWTTLALALLCGACSIQPVKLEFAQDHPAQPRAVSPPWPQLSAPLGADDVVRLALAHSPALQADYAQLGIARADAIEAAIIANPVLSLERRSSSVGVERGVSIMQDLLGVVTLPARKQLARRNLARAQSEAAQRVLAHAAAVRASYYTLQGDAQRLELMATAATAASAAAELAQRQHSAGNITRLQLAQHQAFNAETQLELARARSQYDRDRKMLNSLLGAWGANAQWTLPQRLPAPPANSPGFADAEASALTQRLELFAAKHTLESTQAALAFTRSNRLLSTLGIGFARSKESDDQVLKGPSVEIGLPLFDRAQGQIARLQASAQEQEQRLRQLAIDIRAEVRAARQRVASSYARVKQHENELLPLHETIVAETQLRYNGMLTDVYELLNAKRAQLAVAQSYVESLREYWLAHVELERAIGARLDEPSAPRSPLQPPPQPSAAPAHQHEHHKQ